MTSSSHLETVADRIKAPLGALSLVVNPEDEDHED